jgi:hypothetical protein
MLKIVSRRLKPALNAGTLSQREPLRHPKANGKSVFLQPLELLRFLNAL